MLMNYVVFGYMPSAVRLHSISISTFNSIDLGFGSRFM